MIIKFNKASNTDVLLYYDLIEQSKIENGRISFSLFDTSSHAVTISFTESETVAIRCNSIELFIN